MTKAEVVRTYVNSSRYLRVLGCQTGIYTALYKAKLVCRIRSQIVSIENVVASANSQSDC